MSDLPTVGDSRRMGMLTLTVHCDAGICGHTKRFTFSELGLPDEMIFVRIGRYRRFKCSRCGSRRVEIAPDWTDVKMHGTGVPGRTG